MDRSTAEGPGTPGTAMKPRLGAPAAEHGRQRVPAPFKLLPSVGPVWRLFCPSFFVSLPRGAVTFGGFVESNGERKRDIFSSPLLVLVLLVVSCFSPPAHNNKTFTTKQWRADCDHPRNIATTSIFITSSS
eukprot:180738-Rhodomonas_salina.3